MGKAPAEYAHGGRFRLLSLGESAHDMKDLRDHLLHLEGLIEHINGQLTAPNCVPFERQHLQSQLQIAKLALFHCRTGVTLEEKLDSFED